MVNSDKKMRKFLITKLICSRCGENLSLTYDKPKGSSKHADGEPTGGEKVEVRVAVEPCDTCLRPIKEVEEALSVLLNFKKESHE